MALTWLPSTPPQLPPRSTHNATTKPFRFLDLPKDIRLMVYEQLPITENHHQIPLDDRSHHITLVNPSVTGIRILATCRTVNEEASYILSPRLTQMLQDPPKILVEAKHIVGLIPLHDGWRYQHNILDVILEAVKFTSTRAAIDKYRKCGDVAFDRIRRLLDVGTLVDKNDRVLIKAVATFVLRAAKYIESQPDTMYKYPPMAIVITIPATFRAGIVTTTTSRTMALYHRLATGNPSSRVHIGQARLGWLIRRFVFHITIKSWYSRSLAFQILLRYTKDERGVAIPVRNDLEDRVQACVMLGVIDAGKSGRGLVYYGGVVHDGAGDLEVPQ